MRRGGAIAIAAASFLAAALAAPPAPDPGTQLENNARERHWNEPTEPAHIVGPIYYVGTAGLSSWLIKTSEGHILIDTGMPPSGPMIAESIRKLGFKPEEIRLLLVGHAHVDHVGALAYMKQLSGAKVAALPGEVALLESGGKTDFQYGTFEQYQFEPVKVDTVLTDGEPFRLGDVSLTPIATPGHTRGCTTFVTSVVDSGKAYKVAFPDGTSIPGYRLVKDPSYPGIADDYRRSLGALAMLSPDIWLTAHPDMFGFASKRYVAARRGAAAYVDREGYRKFITDARENLEATIKEQTVGGANEEVK